MKKFVAGLLLGMLFSFPAYGQNSVDEMVRTSTALIRVIREFEAMTTELVKLNNPEVDAVMRPHLRRISVIARQALAPTN